MSSKSVDNLRIVYILYMVGAFFGIVMIVGVILAYIERGKITDLWLESHVEKQIRIFWIWLALAIVPIVAVLLFLIPATFALSSGEFTGGILAGIGVLFLLLLFLPFATLLYVLISSIRSLRNLDRGEEIESL